MIQRLETRMGNVKIPSYGRLDEIHKDLIEFLGWSGLTVTINGWGYTVTDKGFILNDKKHLDEIKTPEEVGRLHPGMAILIRHVREEDEGCLLTYCEIITTARIPHIIDRCRSCGDPLVASERRHTLCNSCYATETS